ncbi:MAG: DUF4345 family protein [Ilumatobacteraceae bacterium]
MALPSRADAAMKLLGYAGAVVSVAAGVVGFLFPRRVSRVVGLQIPGPLGVSEFRATYGGLFIGGGIAVLLLDSAEATRVLGCGWAGAFVARAISIMIDRSRSKENVAGLAIEAAVAMLLLLG